jgi:hypothetical protein
MLELTGIGSLLRGASVLYWLLAIAALVLVAWKVKRWPYKVAGALAVVGLFGYAPFTSWQELQRREAYAREAWSYFKKKCDTESGEKIYKTFTDVRSVVVVKPLPRASEKDHRDQFWYGDPYSASASSDRAAYAATLLTMARRHRSGTGVQVGLDFVEMKNESGDGYIRIHRPESNDKLSVKEPIQQPVSRFGVSWDDISTPEDRKYWVAGSRFRVIDLTDSSVVAERIGFLIEAGFGSAMAPWLSARGIGPNGRSCPDAHDATDQWFITGVFKQDGGK